MVGWHSLIGVGEAAITGLVVAGVIAVRPDLVHGARPLLERRLLGIRTGTPAGRRAPARLEIVALLCFVVVAGVTPRDWFAAYGASTWSSCWGSWRRAGSRRLGVLASLTLAATTEPHDVVAGLERPRLPQQLVAILGFMVRYLDVVSDAMRRMRVARQSRGLRRPRPPALAGPGAGRRGAVHPLLRARRAGPPRDGLARLDREDAAPMTTPALDIRGLAYAYPDGHQCGCPGCR